MADYSTPLGKFEQQRRQAKQRDIEWLLTFDEWFGLWQESGKWEMRGKRAGQYVMARKGDVGPYSVGNVFICTHAKNVSDGSRINLGTGRGWTYRANARGCPYQVVVAHRYVGVYATQAEAEAAYIAAVSEVRACHEL
jgi:hypothetical protein